MQFYHDKGSYKRTHRLKFFMYGILTSFLLIIFAVVAGCALIAPRVPRQQAQQNQQTTPNQEVPHEPQIGTAEDAAPGEGSQGEAAGLPPAVGSPVNASPTIAAAARVIPSVVGITTVNVGRDVNAEERRVQGVGSGVIIDPNGFILTNNHVAGLEAQRITVSLYDGREVRGRAIWADPILDLSVIKIDADRLTTATLGDSQAVQIGEQAIAIGNPLGLTFQRTVTAGIISALNRTISVERGSFMEGLIQTDASINPGNSGGPLINVRGEVVGINTVKVIIAEGIGFAVPINVIKPVIQRIQRDGTYATPTMGVVGLDKELSHFYDFVIEDGIYVFDCKQGECGHKAGIRKGDVILSINDRELHTAAEFRETLFDVGVGNVAKVKLRDRNGKEREVNVKLQERKLVN
jgi:serine protease Do